jgi:hypothetical protein
MGGNSSQLVHAPLTVDNDGITHAEQLYLEKKGFYDTNWQVSTYECSPSSGSMWGGGGTDCSKQAGDTRKLNGLIVGGKCPAGTSMSGFKLIRRRGKKQPNSNYRLPPEWAYRYKCNENTQKGNCQIRSTDFMEASNYEYGKNKFTNKTTLGDLRYLSKHNVMCRDGESLTNFQLEKSSDGSRVKYKYTCCENPTNNCSMMNTPTYNSSKGDPHYLRRADVQCPKGTIMSGMKLQKFGSGNFNYQYKCCVPINEVNCNKFWRNPDLWPSPNSQHTKQCKSWTNCTEGKTCGGTRDTPDFVCIKNQKTGRNSYMKVGDIPRLDPASMQRAEDVLLRGSNTNYYQLCKHWLNNPNPSKTWKNKDPDARKCTSFCQNYIVYNPTSFRGRQSRTEIEGFPLWKIKGLEES